MAVTREVSNKFKLEQGKGSVDFGTDEFRVILMQDLDTFTFDKDLHGTYGDLSASELAEGYGYAQLDKILDVDEVWQQDNVNDKAYLTWLNPTWTASGGSIGPTSAAVVVQYNSVTPADSLVVGCISFGEDITVTDGISFQVQLMGFENTEAA